jgi:2,5-diamino-6-(ribosylamino)-4(3H)-pyrimidinone 5'-phosphate reductase
MNRRHGRGALAPKPLRARAGSEPKRPFVYVNMAISADGKIATANRAVSSFGSARDQAHLLELRAGADAVMAGARTVDSQPVTLGPGPTRYRRLRERQGLAPYNLRIVASRSASVNPRAEVFRHRFSPVIVLVGGGADRRRLDRLRRMAAEVKICGQGQIDFERALRWLRERWGIQRLLCEGGGELNGALFSAGLVDELHLTVCPKIFGGRFAPTIADAVGVSNLADATDLELQSARRRGQEMFLVYRAVRPAGRRSGRTRRPHPKA